MNDVHSENLFERLEPPEGGLAGLLARLERDRLRRRRRRRIEGALAVGAVVAFAVLAVVVPSAEPESVRLDLRPLSYRLGLERPPGEAVVVPVEQRGSVAVRRVPLARDDVVFYLVASRGQEADRPDEAEGASDRPPR